MTSPTSRKQLKHLSRDAMLKEAGPSGFGVSAIVLIVGMLGAFIAWGNFVETTTATQAAGEIIPSGDERVVQHLEGGIVKTVAVSEGDTVKAGDVLVSFEPTLRAAELDQVRAREAALMIRAARLRALISGEAPDFGGLEDTYPKMVDEAKFTLLAQLDAHEQQREVMRSRIEQRRKSVAVFTKQAKSLDEQRNLVDEAVAMRRTLFNSGHGSRVNLLSSQLELARVQASITEANASAEEAEVAVEEARNQLIELDVTAKGRALEELSEVTAELVEVRENVARLADRFRRLELRAPVAGVVHALEINTPGAVVEPAQVLMKIIPLDEAVVVEARIHPRDIGHVRVGQEAKVTVNGFDARRYGNIPGKLTQVSANSFTDEEGRSFFKGKVLLSEQQISGVDGTFRLLPGMTVQADITTGRQTLISYLAGPVHGALERAFTER